MKKILYAAVLLFSLHINAQEQTDDCIATIDKNEDGTEIKTTQEYLMYENVFGDTSHFLFLNLGNSSGTPFVDFKLLSKSKGFPQKYCLNTGSRIHIQLVNNKVVTLVCITSDACASLMYDSNEKNNIRILSGSFLFTKGSPEELEKSPISFIRVQYASDMVDYPVKREITSETNGKKYYPDTYFMNHLKCIK